jgi:predicted dehydrogenase
VFRVPGAVKLTFPERTITSAPKEGTTITVTTPTHVTGVLDFARGAVGTLITSFDVWGSELPRLEIYGTEGTLSAPDPNTFGGPVRVLHAGATEWREMPLLHGGSLNTRGIGLADMADALRSGRPHRASGELAYHVLDIMHALYDAADQGRHVELSSFPRP